MNSHVTEGDPIDLYTGLYVRTNTDLFVRDTIPIGVQRTYRNADNRSRSFGIGTSHLYDMFIVGDAAAFTYVELILADGGRIRYDRVSPGRGYADGVFEHTSTPTEFYRSRITWNGGGWTVALHDGSAYKLLGCNPSSTKPGQCGAVEFRSSRGEIVGIKRQPNGDITRVISPHGKWIAFTYDEKDRVTVAEASDGRTVKYGYDGKGLPITVTPSRGPKLRYGYDDENRLTTIFERGEVIRNFYDQDLCVRQLWSFRKKRMVFKFKYIFDNQKRHVETDVGEPDGTVRKVVFNEHGYPVSDTRHLGRKDEAALIYRRDSRTNALQNLTVTCSSKQITLRLTKPIGRLQVGESEDDPEELLALCAGAISKKSRVSRTRSK